MNTGSVSIQVALNFRCTARDKVSDRQVTLTSAVIAGWTGRDKEAMEKHITELEALGVTRPRTTPIFYRTSAARVTTAKVIEVTGNGSSGEVEFVLIQHEGEQWVGVGSDHTDREVETYSVTVSKQMCEKPVAPELWLYEDVSAHWDQLILRSFIVNGERRELYQEGVAGAMLAPDDLIGKFTDGDSRLPDGTVMFGGTLAAIGGVRPAGRFEFELEDPVLHRRISYGYDVLKLPVQG
ncbi:MAG: DUF2848 domain-containing protein [Gammaproteobacteria bacterium]|nr:DUF2848 domain-containing protein [Gammaproteobacteria bacterium]